MKYLETNSFDPYYNLAFEEYVLNNNKDDDYLMLWQNDNTIVIGVNQNALEEINFTEVKKANVNIARRITGGGAVYHDLGNLNFSYITDWNDGENRNYGHFLQPITEAFAEIGIKIEIKGRNDLVIDGKKISGSAQSLVNDRILHHGTLLINSNLDIVGKMLNASPEKMQSKGVKSVRSRVTNIQNYTTKELNIDNVKDLLLRHWFGENDVKLSKLNEKALEEIVNMKNEKYSTWDWIYGRSPDFNFKNKKRFAGGEIETNLDICEGMIRNCIISGDFLALKDVRDVEESLKNKKYDEKEVERIIKSLPVKLYFGDISAEEITSCFFM